jgi:hypothetical protein
MGIFRRYSSSAFPAAGMTVTKSPFKSHFNDSGLVFIMSKCACVKYAMASVPSGGFLSMAGTAHFAPDAI